MIGHIEWRGKNKDHARLMVTVGVNINRQPIKKYKSIGKVSQKEAEKALANFITDIENGSFMDTTKIKFSTFVDTWLKNYAETNLRPKTLFRYKQILTSRIMPEFGHYQMQKITPLLIASFYRKLQEPLARTDGKKGTLSPQTVLHHHRLLHAIFEHAVKWQVISSNPVSQTTAPKVPRKEAMHYEEQQLRELLLALSNESYHFQVIIIMAIETGLRESELMGLLWSHLDLTNRMVRIEQTRHYVPKVGNVINPPKTEQSRRQLSISTTLAQMLSELKQKQDCIRPFNCPLENDWVFLSGLGLPLHATTMSSWFPRFLKRHNLPPLRFHGLRHTSATILNARGLDIASLSKRLGHSTKMTTLNIYTHSFANTNAIASTIMEEVITKNLTPTSDTSPLN